MRLIGSEKVFGNKDVIDEIPRPSIKRMKELFDGRVVKGAEIGVRRAKNSKSILKELNINKLFLVDIWKNYKGIRKGSDMELYYKEVREEFEGNNKITIIKNNSLDASKMIEDASLDFVYIDANHEYEYVKKDIDAWFEKVKGNGIVAGHDVFNSGGVLKAVKEFCCEKGILFFIDLPDWYFIKEGLN